MTSPLTSQIRYPVIDPPRGVPDIMAKLTIGFGVLLILLGILGFVSTGSAHPTALIPTWIGLLFGIFGVMANTENSKKRMLWMHISVTVALLVFLFMIPAAIDCIRLAHGAYFPYPAAVEEKAALGLFSLIYVLFCVRSFIAARRSRLA
jgi:fucose 4-O-acetylase-like acetyltransferase